MDNISEYLDGLAKSDPKQTIREHTDELLKCANELHKIYKIDDRLYDLLLLACEYHDYGKINTQFQQRINTGKSFDEEKEIAHNILSCYFVEKNCDLNDYYYILYAVMYHHQCSLQNIIRDNEKMELINELLSPFPYNKLNLMRLAAVFKNLRNNPQTILLKGLLHRCDYAASAGIDVEYPNDFLNNKMNDLLFKWNDMQIFCKEHSEDNIIITAPTGMGKTEAALLWVGDSKGIYVLPLITAINVIFERISSDILNGEHIDDRLALLHSAATGFLSSNDKYCEMDLYEYRKKSRQLAFPLTVSTLDQIFDFVLKTGGYEMKLATLAYSKVVIDEIQSYNATLLAYLIYGLHKIIELGGKVAIITATLPSFVKDYIFNNKNISNTFLCQDYSSGKYNHKIRHNVKVVNAELCIDDIKEKYSSNIEKGVSNKILVICNTVLKAQLVYDLLLDQLGCEQKNQIYMLHAKFIKTDRNKLEKMIKEDGKTDNNKNVIWISTQVVEASVDIDFDYLFTELSDLNGLFQRFGRCNRKGEKSVEETNCFVYTHINPRLLMGENDKNGFIDQKMYELSMEALKEVDGLITEEKKTDLINRYFTTENIKGSAFEKMYKKAYEYIEGLEVNELSEFDKDRKFRNILSISIIPQEVYEDKIEQINMWLKELKTTMPKNADKSEKSKIWQEKQKARDNILSLTVNVGRNEVKGPLGISQIDLNSYEHIMVLKCEYSSETGFKKYNKQKIEDIEVNVFL